MLEKFFDLLNNDKLTNNVKQSLKTYKFSVMNFVNFIY